MDYNYKCWDCEVDIVIDRPMGKSPKKTKCPSCNKMSERNYETMTFHMKGDCHTNRAKIFKKQRLGLDKQEAHTFYNQSIEASKERQKTGGHQYASYDFTEEQCAGLGARKLNPEEQTAKRERDRTLTAMQHDKAGLTPNKKHKQS
jgi:hypothetical protein